MKFLLIGFAIAFVVGISIIALAYFSARSKEKGDEAKISKASTPQGVKRIFRFVMIVILLGLTVIVGIKVIKRHSPAIYPIAADAQDVSPQIGQTVKVKIYSNCWSGWIKLPIDPSGVGYFHVKTPGETEILFWSGERRYISDKMSPQWFRSIPHKNFRLRGAPGEAEITIQ